MVYSIVWKFGGGATERQMFDGDVEDAKVEATNRALAYAREYGRCETTVHDESGQQHLIRVDDYHG